MAKKYYSKELASTPFLVNGIKVNFEIYADDTGGIALDDSIPANEPLINALDYAASKQIGGVVSIDEAGYEELKKKVSLRKSVKPQKELLRVLNPLPKPKLTPSEPQDLPASVEVAEDKTTKPAPPASALESTPAADEAPKKTFKPRTKKVDVETPATV
jgi:hypothetical protein